MWIKRDNEALVSQLAAEQPVVVVTGPRQVGKTALLEHVFAAARYISLDEPLQAEAAEADGMQFLRGHDTPLIIDEVQHAPALLRSIKARVDRRRRTYGQYLLTGSQKFGLMQGVTESLAGRVALLSCFTLSAQEIESHLGRVLEGAQLLDTLVRGGYPGLYVQDRAPERFFAEYVATYLERDVRSALNVRSLRDFNRFMRLTAARTGQLISAHGLATELGVNTQTVKNWLSVLEASELIALIEPYHRNLGKRLVKTPKLYFLDTGLCCHLLGITSGVQLRRHAALGALFETHVAGQLLRALAHRGATRRLLFFRDHAGHEVDFVIEDSDRVHLLECKWSAASGVKLPGFVEMTRLLGEGAIASRAVVSSHRESFRMASGIYRSDSIVFPHLKTVLDT